MPKNKSPTAIFMGMATIIICIWGTVLATRPNATLVNSKAAMIGAPAFTAMMNMLPVRVIRYSINELPNWKLNGGTMLKLSAMARKKK